MAFSHPQAADPGALFVAGASRVGRAFAELFHSRGVYVSGVWNRTPAEPVEGIPLFSGEDAWPEPLGAARTVIIAVRDQAITPVASRLRGALGAGACVLHCSGSQPAGQALAPLAGHPRAMFHPLVAVRDRQQALRHLPQAMYAVQGDDEAVTVCATLCRILRAEYTRLSGEALGLYHAAAVVASNHTVALWSAAQDLLVSAGVADPGKAGRMLLPLIRSCVENVESLGLPEALTGPVRRGDIVTISRHLRCLADRPGVLQSYRADALLAVQALESLPEPEGGVDLAGMRRVLLADDAD